MKVLITGATGYLGSHSTAEIVRAGHQVRLLVRNPGKLGPALKPLGVDPDSLDTLVGDITDEATVARAVQDCDAVLHGAGVFTYDSREHKRLRNTHVRGMRTVLEAAFDAGVPKVIYVSSIAGFLPTGGRPVTPYSQIPKHTEEYAASQGEAEQLARQYYDDGKPLSITYPLIILGPNDPTLGDGLGRMKRILQGKLPVLPTGGFPVGDVRDVGLMHAAVVGHEENRGRYMLGGEFMSTQTYMDLLREATGRPLPMRFLPSGRLMPLGRVANWVSLATGKPIPFQYGGIHMCHRQPRVDESIGDVLGVHPRPLRATMFDSVRWLYQSGHITAAEAGRAAEDMAAA